MSTPLDTIEIVREYTTWKEERTLNGKPADVDAYEEYLEVRALRDALKEIRDMAGAMVTPDVSEFDHIYDKANAALQATIALEPRPLPVVTLKPLDLQELANMGGSI